jgi:4'-phosphopantetheinyl transferase
MTGAGSAVADHHPGRLAFERPPFGTARRPPPLSATEVHLWHADLDRNDWAGEGMLSVLEPRERLRADRIRVPERRSRYIAARVVLRRLLGLYTGLPADAVRFAYGARGKPRLEDPGLAAGLQFNATDAGTLLLVAVTAGAEVGIDLEIADREVRHDSLIRRYFAPLDQRCLYDVPDDRRRLAFLACWTRKEAYGKAEGVGIHYPLGGLASCARMDCARIWLPSLNPIIPRRWRLVQLTTPANGVAAVVVDGLEPELVCHCW